MNEKQQKKYLSINENKVVETPPPPPSMGIILMNTNNLYVKASKRKIDAKYNKVNIADV